MRYYRSLIISLLLCCIGIAGANSISPGQLLFKTVAPITVRGDRTGLSAFDSFLDNLGATNLRPIKGMHLPQYYSVTIPPDRNPADFSGEAYRFEGIEYVQPNYLRKMLIEPNDPLFSRQLHNICSIPSAWNLTTGSPVVVVGIVDSGMLLNHPDLAENIFINEAEIPDNGIDDDGNGYIDDYMGWDFCDAPELADQALGDFMEPDNDPTDENFHGTHVAGIVGAVGNNGTGVSGVAWSVKLLAVRAGFRTTQSQGYLQDDDAAAAVIYAADMGSSVINMSWGDPNYSPIIADACEYAHRKGTSLVASAGNDPVPVLSYPARLSNVISVGAVNKSRVLAGFSSYGVDLDLVAPGELVLSTYKLDAPDQYIEQSGTSMSSPYVAGAIALLKALQPELTPTEVRSRLLNSTDDLGPLGFDIRYGHGLLNVRKLLENTNPPIIEIVNPMEMQGISGSFTIRGTISGTNFHRYTVMRSNQATPSASDWKNVHDDTSDPYYYYQQVQDGAIAQYYIPDHMPEGNYIIRIQYKDILGNTYNYYRTVLYDNSAPQLRAETLAGFKRYDRQNAKYYATAIFNEPVRSSLRIIAYDGTEHYSYSTNLDSLQVWAFPVGVPPGPVRIQISATNFSGLAYLSQLYPNFINVQYETIPTHGFTSEIIGPARVPMSKVHDFDGNGIKEYIAMDLPTSGYGRVRAYEPSPAGHLTMHDFEDNFRPLSLGNTNASGQELLGLKADRVYLRETQTTVLYPNEIVWADSAVAGGTMANYTSGPTGVLVVKNLPTENVIQAYQRDNAGVMRARNTLRNTTTTSLRNTFIPTILVDNLDNDNLPDILCADTDGDIMIYEVLNHNNQQLTWSHRMPVANTYQITTGDYNGNGIKDFFVGGYYTNILNPDMNFWYFEGFTGTANNTYNSLGSIMFNTVQSQNSIHSADLDDDGKDEIILALSPSLYTIKYENGTWKPTFYGESFQTYQIASWTDQDNSIRFLTNTKGVADSTYAVEWREDTPFTGPPTPILMGVVPQNENEVQINWLDNGSSSYNIYRKDPDGSIHQIAQTDSLSFLDSGLSESQPYEYRISAVHNSYSPSESVPTLWERVIPYRKPAVTSINMISPYELRLIFNQALAPDAINPGYYWVDQAIGTPSSVNLIENHWGIHLRFSRPFSSSVGTYTIKFQNLRGLTGVSPLQNTYTFSYVVDTTSPRIVDAVTNSGHQSVLVVFSESLSPEGIGNLSNYRLTLPATDQQNRIIGTLLQDNSILITFHSKLKYSNQPYYLEINGLKDLSGNLISPQYNFARFLLDDIRDLSKVKIYPNPIHAGEQHWLTFINFPAGKKGRIAIFDTSGNIVYSSAIGPFNVATNNITWRWNLINQGGSRISSGIYYYVIEMDGETKRGQIAVIR